MDPKKISFYFGSYKLCRFLGSVSATLDNSGSVKVNWKRTVCVLHMPKMQQYLLFSSKEHFVVTFELKINNLNINLNIMFVSPIERLCQPSWGSSRTGLSWPCSAFSFLVSGSLRRSTWCSRWALLPTSVVDPNTLNLDPNPGIWHNINPVPDLDPGLCCQFERKN